MISRILTKARVVAIAAVDRVTKAAHSIVQKRRSPKWRATRRHHLLVEDWCRACGSLDHLEVHHVEPYHLVPEKELDRNNLITLCEGPNRCHLKKGHLGAWRRINPNIREEARVMRPISRIV